MIRKGLKFQCQPDCGKCCVSHDDYAFTFLTEEDLARLEKHLGKPRETFAMKGKFDRTRSSDLPAERWYLKMTGPRCQFLKGTGCGIYDARPTQCRTFPFWPENMPKNDWEDLKSFCPGIGKGPAWPKEKVKDLVMEQKNADTSK